MSKTQTEFITVTGISLKEEKEKGWISCVKTNSSSCHFQKKILLQLLLNLVFIKFS